MIAPPELAWLNHEPGSWRMVAHSHASMIARFAYYTIFEQSLHLYFSQKKWSTLSGSQIHRQNNNPRLQHTYRFLEPG
jgi:hypothetical protein